MDRQTLKTMADATNSPYFEKVSKLVAQAAEEGYYNINIHNPSLILEMPSDKKIQESICEGIVNYWRERRCGANMALDSANIVRYINISWG